MSKPKNEVTNLGRTTGLKASEASHSFIHSPPCSPICHGQLLFFFFFFTRTLDVSVVTEATDYCYPTIQPSTYLHHTPDPDAYMCAYQSPWLDDICTIVPDGCISVVQYTRGHAQSKLSLPFSHRDTARTARSVDTMSIPVAPAGATASGFETLRHVS